jgi:ribosomal protein S27E
LIELSLACPGCGKEWRVLRSEDSGDGNAICDACGRTLYEIRVLSGYVYVLSNPRMPGLLKIGCTTRSVAERVDELNSATGVPCPFVVEAYFAVASPEEVEANIHRQLSQQRVPGREFFEIEVKEVVRMLEAATGSCAAYHREPPCSPRRWTCGLCKHQWIEVDTPEAVKKCPLCSATSLVRLSSA